MAVLLNNLAEVLLDEGKLGEAETLYRQALAIQKKTVGNENPNVASYMNDLGGALALQGKLAEAETLLREALTMRSNLLGSEHPDVAASLNNLAFCASKARQAGGSGDLAPRGAGDANKTAGARTSERGRLA